MCEFSKYNPLITNNKEMAQAYGLCVGYVTMLFCLYNPYCRESCRTGWQYKHANVYVVMTFRINPHNLRLGAMMKL